MKKSFIFISILVLCVWGPVRVSATITGWKSVNQRSGFVNDYIMCMVSDHKGNMWFGTGDGVVKLSADGKTWTRYNPRNSGILSKYTYSIAVDKNDNMWFGTLAGVSKLSADGVTWKTFDGSSGIGSLFTGNPEVVTDITQDKDGNMWFRTSGVEWHTHEQLDADSNLIIYYTGSGGLAKLSVDNKWTTYGSTASLGSFVVHQIRGLMMDKDGNMWFSAIEGVSKLAPNGTCTTYTPGNSGLNSDANGAELIMQDRNGNMWFSVKHRGVSKLSADGKTWVSYNEKNSGLADDWVSSMMQDKAGNIWFGSETCQGVSRLSADGTSWVTFTGMGAYNTTTKRYVDPQKEGTYEYPDCLSTNINCIAQDSSGNMWIGTHGYGMAEAMCKSLFAHTDTLGIGTETGNSASLTVVSDVSWTASVDVTWLKIQPTTGSPGMSFITVTRNPIPFRAMALVDSSVGRITIHGSDGSEYSVTVQPLAFMTSTDNITLRADKWSSAPIGITSNTQWRVTYAQDHLWFILVSDSGLTRETSTLVFNGTDSISVFAAENNYSVSSRKTVLNFTSGVLKKNVTVTQDPLLSIVPHSVILDSTQGSVGSYSLRIGTASRVQWTAVAGSGWFSVDRGTGSDSSGSGKLDLKVTALTANTAPSLRSAQLVVTAAGVRDTIIIYQKGTDGKGVVSSVDVHAESIPKTYVLKQNYPNPFNPSTTLSFSLPATSFVTLKIFDIMGRDVATIACEEMVAGNHSRQWNATGFPSGVYFYRMQAGSYTDTKRLILLR